MAEYRNGLNYRGQMAVEKKDVNSDVQTGRAVFVDEDKYEKDADYKAKVDKCIEEGFHRVSGDGSSGGEGSGGSEPLIITPTESGLGVTFEEIDSAVNEHRNIFIDNDLVAGTNKIVPPSGSAHSYYELATIATEPGTTTILVEVVRVNADSTFSSRVFSITGMELSQTNTTA